MSTQLNQNLGKFESKEPTLFDRIFRDNEGNIVIAQKPNLPILLGLTATALHFVLPAGQLQTTTSVIAFGTLYAWAWMELFQGVNYFRRSLGLVSLVGLIALGGGLISL